MRIQKFFTFLTAILVLSSSSLMAQGLEGEARRKQVKDELMKEIDKEIKEAVKKEMEKYGLKIGSKIFLNWHINMTDSTDTDSGDNSDTFEFERIYLTFKKRFDDIFSARITADVENTEITEDGNEKSKYKLHIKFAYLQAEKSLGPLNAKLQFGMIGTPIIGLTEKLADQRWIHKNFINGAKDIMPTGNSIDNSADMGASMELNLMKIVTIVGAITNGEGFKNSDESEFSDPDDNSKNTKEGKAYYGMLTITPIKSLFISGYYRFEGTSVDEMDNHKGYYGGGLAWKDKLISVGMNYTVPFQKVDGDTPKWTGTDDEYDMFLIDAWISLYLKSIINVPLFIMAKYGFGEDSNQDDSAKTYIGGGLGYQFNKHIRTIAWYQHLDSESADASDEANPEKSFWIKAEIKW